MNAFIGLAAVDQVTLATVAPGIAEALIATAIGLFAAIPAVLAFNHFTAKSESVYSDRALFAEEMIAFIATSICGFVTGRCIMAIQRSGRFERIKKTIKK